MTDERTEEPVYNTRAVVLRTGVPADTFRAWERRHGLPKPTRTAGNQRLYSERDVAAIRWLREQTAAGLSISQAVRRYRTREHGGRRAAGDGAGAPAMLPPGGAEAAGYARWRARILGALARFETGDADRAFEEALALGTVEDVCTRVVQPVLIEIGERWARGEVAVGAEHFATAFFVRKLGALFNVAQVEHGRGPLLAACPDGEQHEVGLLMVSLFLARRGYRVVYLGQNVPLPDLQAAVRGVRPVMVLLSSATSGGAERLIAAAEGLAGTLVGFGGRAFVEDPASRARVAAVYLGGSAAEAVEGVERIVGGGN
jgi:DNA-binding transcriptional MerR regulator